MHTAKDSWAQGLAVFAGAMLMLIGIFQMLAGVTVLVDAAFYGTLPDYAFRWDPAVWGWVHLVLGVVLAFAAYGVFAGRTWARGVGMAVAGVSAVQNFLVLPHYPAWSVLIIALDVAVIWALAVHVRPDRD